MRTTVNLDEDVLAAAKELAAMKRSTLGRILSDLARRSLAAPQSPGNVRNGVPVLPPRRGEGVVTPEIVRRLLDEE